MTNGNYRIVISKEWRDEKETDSYKREKSIVIYEQRVDDLDIKIVIDAVNLSSTKEGIATAPQQNT